LPEARIKEEITKHKKTAAKARAIKLSELLAPYERAIQGLAPLLKEQENRF